MTLIDTNKMTQVIYKKKVILTFLNLFAFISVIRGPYTINLSSYGV